MSETTGVPAEDRAIGERVRTVRRRRGLSVETTAGLAGIDKSHLSRLETGQRAFIRRGLLEDLAAALTCSVADLTGQPYPAADQQTALATLAIPDLNLAFYDSTLDDVPDVPARPLRTLVAEVSAANAHADDVQYDLAGRNLGALITELQVTAATVPSDRETALASLAEACIVAYGLARTTGHIELAVTAARRGFDAATRAERLDLIGLASMCRAVALMRLGARRGASTAITGALTDLFEQPGPVGDHTEIAEARGMLHLTAALVAARDGDTGACSTHISEARTLARHTGERNHLRFHFGPANVEAWNLSLAIESNNGPTAAERYTASAVDLSVFRSRDREAGVHFDLARAWSQADGDRDQQAIRALDAADKAAPLRVRNDPIARDLVIDLHRRSKRRVWELDSLRSRLGVA
jgi:transcriptional regulator with XRE-family HTH domain